MSWLSDIMSTSSQRHAARVAKANLEISEEAAVTAAATALAEEIKAYPIRGEIESLKAEIKQTQTQSLFHLRLTNEDRKEQVSALNLELQKLEREYEREKNELGTMGEYLLTPFGAIFGEAEPVSVEKQDNSGLLLILGIIGLICYRSLR